MILQKYLKIFNASELFQRDQLGLLKQIIKASLINFPFQNATSFGRYLPLHRKGPGFHEVLEGSLHGKGGMCGHLNMYMKLQLESLGYNVDLIGGCFRRNGIPMSHFLVKVKIPGHVIKDNHLSSGNQSKMDDRTYIIDVGGGVPISEPIWLENLPHFGRAGGLNYRYERVDENTVQRVNENGDALMGAKPPSYESPQDIIIGLEPKKYTDFVPRVKKIYGDPYSVFLHQGLYCFRYLDIGDDDFTAICIRGKELLQITKETRHVQAFSTYEEMKPSLFKYFPMIPPEDVELSVKHFSIPLEEGIKLSSKSILTT